MVGMSGKANEPRCGTTGTSRKQQLVPGGHNKALPPVEVLQMARILDDSAMTVSVLELDKLITEVLSVVPSQTNEEASVALYDNNFDVGRAITVLLDSDTGVTTGEWTTTARKGKRKEVGKVGDTDQIIAQGDTKISGGKSSRGTGTRGGNNKSASGTTARDITGGGVSASNTEGSRGLSKGGRGQGGGQVGRGQDGRGRSQSGKRSADRSKGSNSDRDRRREKGGGERGDNRRERGERSERRERGVERSGGGAMSGSRNRSKGRPRDKTTAESEQSWDVVLSHSGTTDPPYAGQLATTLMMSSSHHMDNKTQQPVHFMDTANSWGASTDNWNEPQTATLAVTDKVESQMWEAGNEDPLIGTEPNTPLFPDALPPSTYQTQLSALSTAAETTPNLMSVAEGSDRALHLQASEQRGDQYSTKPAATTTAASAAGSVPPHPYRGDQYSTKPAAATTAASANIGVNKRSKRLARSRIPTTPVEMPGGVETLDLEFGEFRIDFIGPDQHESRTPTTSSTPVSADFTSPIERRNMYLDIQRLSDDPSVLSVVSSSMPSQPLPTDTPTSPVGVATSYSHQSLEQPSVGVSTPGLPRMGEQVETNDVLLGGPPGLTRLASVSSHDSAKSSQPLSSSSQQQQHLPMSVVSSSSPSTPSAGSKPLGPVQGLGETSHITTSSVSLQMPEPIAMPHQQAQMQSTHNQGQYQVTTSNSDLLMASVTSATPAVNLATSMGVASALPSSAHLRNVNAQHSMVHNSTTLHSNLQQVQQQTSKPVPAGMMYHHNPMNMMAAAAQYPFVPMYQPNYPDPTDLNRFPVPVSMAYYPSSDHTLAASSTFGGGMADQTKYGRGSTDSTAAVTSQQQQPGSGNVLQQQQQHLAAHFMNYPAYGFYSPMYQMPTGFSAPHNMAPKPSAAGSNLSNYQHHGVSSAFGMITGGGGAYEDMLSAGVTSGSDFARKMYGSSLSKTTSLPTTGGDVGSGVVGVAGGGASSAFTKHTYEGSKSMVGSAAGSYSFGMPGNQGYMGAAYMGIPTMPVHHHHMPTAANPVLQGGGSHDTAGGNVVTRVLPSGPGGFQKHGNKGVAPYPNTGLWSQGAHS